jgi:outer membrane biosynthesis protein TonB
LVVAALSAAAASAPAQRALPRVVVVDTSVVPGNPELVWLADRLRMKPVLYGGMRLVYPDSLRLKGISGRVTLEFVVDTLGRVEPGVRVLRTAHPLLVAPAKQMLLGARFVPGRVRGRPVRVLMRMGLRVAPESR